MVHLGRKWTLLGWRLFHLRLEVESLGVGGEGTTKDTGRRRITVKEWTSQECGLYRGFS